MASTTNISGSVLHKTSVRFGSDEPKEGGATKVEMTFHDSFDRPMNKEKKAEDLIFWGEKNAYPDYLLDLFDGSSTHGAIISGKVDYIVARGLQSKKNGSIQDFIQECNCNGDSLNDILYRITFDYEMFGCFALQIVWGKGSNKNNPKISEIYHIPVERFRYNLDQTKLKYSKHWKTYSRAKIIEYDVFDLDNPTGTQIFYHNGNTSRNIYGRPPYEAAVASINTDRGISEYHDNLVRNGMAASMIINFFDGTPTDDEQRQITRDITTKFSGANGSQKMITFNEPGTQAPQVIPIQTSDDDRFIRLMQNTIQNIFSAHRVATPALFGLQTNAQKVGVQNEFEIGYEVFQKTYVLPRRIQLLNVLNKLMAINFKDPQLTIKPMPPVTMPLTDPRTLASCMYPSEMRKNLENWNLIDDANNQPEGEIMIGNRDQPNLDLDVLGNAKKADPNVILPVWTGDTTQGVPPPSAAPVPPPSDAVPGSQEAGDADSDGDNNNSN